MIAFMKVECPWSCALHFSLARESVKDYCHTLALAWKRPWAKAHSTMALLDSTTLYHGSTWLYYTTLQNPTMVLLDSTTLYHGSTWLYYTTLQNPTMVLHDSTTFYHGNLLSLCLRNYTMTDCNDRSHFRSKVMQGQCSFMAKIQLMIWMWNLAYASAANAACIVMCHDKIWNYWCAARSGSPHDASP